MQSTTFMDHVWININLHGSDWLLIGGVYHSPSSHLSTSVDSFCSHLNNYTHLLICGDLDFLVRFVRFYKQQSYWGFCGFGQWFQHVFQPRRFRLNESPSLLDLNFTNKSDMINNLSYLPPVTIFVLKLICSYAMQKKSDNVNCNMRAANPIPADILVGS